MFNKRFGNVVSSFSRNRIPLKIQNRVFCYFGTIRNRILTKKVKHMRNRNSQIFTRNLGRGPKQTRTVVM